eukprot:205600_1
MSELATGESERSPNGRAVVPLIAERLRDAKNQIIKLRNGRTDEHAILVVQRDRFQLSVVLLGAPKAKSVHIEIQTFQLSDLIVEQSFVSRIVINVREHKHDLVLFS